MAPGKAKRLPKSFALRLDPPDARGWSGQVRVVIGGRDLVDRARGVELPKAAAAGQAHIAGSYAGLTPAEFCAMAPDEEGRITVLGCECGISECWPLRVRIRRLGGTVEWSDFTQPCRDWSYAALGPFLFRSDEYDRAVAAMAARAAE